MGDKTTIKVWDAGVRLFHWALVASAAAAYLTPQVNYGVHVQSGYLVLGLVCFRIFWGFAGGHHARFRNFPLHPAQVAGHLKGLVRGGARRYLGHNPAGSVMVLCLLAALAIAALSGIALDAAENRAGPLARTDLYQHEDLVAAVHHIASDAFIVLLILHLLGVAISSWRQRENLLLAMFTGHKRRHG